MDGHHDGLPAVVQVVRIQLEALVLQQEVAATKTVWTSAVDCELEEVLHSCVEEAKLAGSQVAPSHYMMVVEVEGAHMEQGEGAGRPGRDLRRVQVLALVEEELSEHELAEAKHKKQKD
jgi:hypothetical protein